MAILGLRLLRPPLPNPSEGAIQLVKEAKYKPLKGETELVVFPLLHFNNVILLTSDEFPAVSLQK